MYTSLATLTFYTACAVCVTIFSTGRKFHPVSIFTLLHALTLVACSYALLTWMNVLTAHE